MLTRCPACETHFRVTAEQLKIRSGRVRCGECQNVFNALDSLIEEPVLAAAQPTPEPPSQYVAPSVGSDEAAAGDHPKVPADEVAVPPAPTSDPAPTREERKDASASAPNEMESPATGTAAEPAQPITNQPESIEPIASATTDWSETFPEPAPPPRRWPWVIGSIVALAAMGMQAALAFRVELAVLWPEAKPALIIICSIADCEVDLPSKAALIGIEASDLHPDGEHPGRLALTATLKNRAPFAQQFPHLELTLTDTADKAIARKVLAPVDYLPPKTAFARGMPPNADIMVAIGVEPGEMAASGYRLYLFYP